MNSTATTTPPPAAKRKRNPLLGNHMSSVVVSVIVNLGLLVLLLFMIQLSEPASKEETVFRMMDVEQVEMEDIQELIEPEDVEPDLTDDMTMDMNLEDMVTEMLDDSIPQEEAAIQPVVSPVIMEGLAQAAGINFNDYLVDGSRATRFMGQSGKGNRFAFVIDYSKSMNKQQLAVMKHELTSAITAIGEKGMVSLLFFSGPVWRPDQDAEDIVARWKKDWTEKTNPNFPNPRWLVSTGENLEALERMIHQTPTTLGTDWYPPLKMALEIEPPPDILFFMTDGRCSENSMRRAVSLVESLPKGSVQINTVALGVAIEDVAALKTIAELTSGTFRHYNKEQLSEVFEKLPKPPDDFSDATLDYLEANEALIRMLDNQELKQPVREEEDAVSFDI